MKKEITTYKAFNTDWTCRGFKYEVGKKYEMGGEIKACKRGFHGCENPLDVLSYYDLTDSRFAVCTQFGTVSPAASDSKVASSGISVDKELSLGELITASVEWALRENNTDSGYSARLAASGDHARLAASGDHARLASSGDSAKLASSGFNARLAASGDSAKLASSGFNAQLASSGGSTKLASSGYNGVVSSSGPNSQAKGAVGTWISIAEFKDGRCVGFATGCVGEDGLEPDVFYKAKNGKLVKA